MKERSSCIVVGGIANLAQGPAQGQAPEGFGVKFEGSMDVSQNVANVLRTRVETMSLVRDIIRENGLGSLSTRISKDACMRNKNTLF